MSLAKFIEKRREELGMNQRDLSDRLGWTSPQFISNIERGNSLLPAKHIVTVARVLKVRPSVLTDLIIKDKEKRLKLAVKQQQNGVISEDGNIAIRDGKVS